MLASTKTELFRTLLAVSESPNLFSAGQKLGLSQPTVSRHLQDLERALGIPLFVESGRRKIMSPFALNLCNKLDDVFKNLEDEINHWQAQSQDFSRHVLRIGGRMSLNARVMRIAPVFPQITAVEMQTKDVTQALIDRKIDMGIVENVPVRSEIISKRLFKESMQLVVSPKLVRSGMGVSEMIRTVPCLAFRSDLPVFLSFLKHYKCSLENLRFSRVIADWPVLVELCSKELGWLLAPEGFLENTSGLKSMDLPAGAVAPTSFYLLVRRDLRSLTGFKEWFANF